MRENLSTDRESVQCPLPFCTGNTASFLRAKTLKCPFLPKQCKENHEFSIVEMYNIDKSLVIKNQKQTGILF